MTSFELEKPEDVKFTLTVTLPLKEWIKVAKELQTPDGVVGYPLKSCIDDVVEQARRTFYPSAKAVE